MYTSMFRKAMLGDTATLNLDFTTGTLDSRLTFTRSGTGTYINSSGYVTTASTNVARFDYDPTTRAPRGLLIEGSAINYMLESVALTQTALKMRAVSTASITDPEGTSNRARIVAADGQTGYHGRYLATTAGTNTTVTISIFAKKNGYKYLNISDLATGRATVQFDLDDGSTSNSIGLGFVSASATPYPHGWWRCSVVSTVIASTSYAWGYVGVPSTGATYHSAGAQYTGENLDDKGIYCYGFQVEGGAGASSYIPTTTSQVTRNADSCVMSNISSLSYSTTNGSMVYHGRFSKINAASYPTRMGFLTSVGDQAFEIFTNGTNIYGSIKDASLDREIIRTVAINTDFKFATAFNTSAASQLRGCLNGASVIGSTTSAMTATRTPTVFGFGRTGYELYFPCGTIKVAKYYNTTLTDAELVSQST
jgi:hypothetical protein